MIKTFSDVKRGNYIYAYQFNNHTILIRKYKILDKKIESYRDKGKFGGIKISKVYLTISLKEYCNKPYNFHHTQTLTFNGQHGVHQEGNMFFGETFFASKQDFISSLKYSLNTCERNINEINAFISKNENNYCSKK